jgi:hypothetical protein
MPQVPTKVTVDFFRGLPVIFRNVDAEKVLEILRRYRSTRECFCVTVEGFSAVPVKYQRVLFEGDLPMRAQVSL